ncbi:MAG: L-lactate permease [Neisseriaceae bacterium]|nr:L-lactate permease [Neisseriaceae bacterium]
MLIFFSVFPIVLLIWMMAKRNGLPSTIALPATAGLLYFLQLFIFKSDLTLLNANIVTALISVLTPLSVIAGAIALYKLMKMSGSEATLSIALTRLTDNPVAQLMIIGWALAFMIEGASGFGTPAAIAAPILVGLGFSALRVALLALVMNSVPVTFGAVGTPTWFGLSQLGLAEADLLLIGQYSAAIHFVAAFVIPFMALRFCVSNAEIKANFAYVLLSILSCTVPYLLLAQVNYEFPSLVGGAIGVGLSIFLAKKTSVYKSKYLIILRSNCPHCPPKTS